MGGLLPVACSTFGVGIYRSCLLCLRLARCIREGRSIAARAHTIRGTADRVSLGDVPWGRGGLENPQLFPQSLLGV